MSATGQSVIVADDDRAVLELLKIRLEVAGFQVCAVRTGSAVIEALRSENPAALIVDAGLTDDTGTGLLQALEQRDERLACPTLILGRKLPAADIALALSLGALDCMAKPFSGSDVLERLGRILRAPDEAVSPHMIEARCLEPAELHARYAHETAEHRQMVFARGTGMCASWKSFRQFLVDMGPAPSADHLATRLAASDLTYVPGKVAWIHRDRQPQLFDPASVIEVSPLVGGEKWTTVRGRQIGFATLAGHLGVPVDVITVALRGKPAADDLVQHASIADTLSQAPMSWLPADRREAFLMGYRMWHMQVSPHFAASATPAFLFLFSAVPGLLKSRTELQALGHWEPATELAKHQREQHPLWRRHSDTLLRVEAARQDLPIYKTYSLSSALDELWSRLERAEQRFRDVSAPSIAIASFRR